MSEFRAFFALGYHHIVGVSALDHIVFLIALAVVYRPGDWRDALWVVSAFTVGHSITLALAVSDTVVVNERIVEFLIPLTIVVTAIENLVMRDRAAVSSSRRYRPLIAGVFGLVHGAGFAGYLRSLFLENITLPLLGFNLGIEAGQLLVLALVTVVLVGLDALIARMRSIVARAMDPGARLPSVLGMRVIGISTAIALVASAWTLERHPW